MVSFYPDSEWTQTFDSAYSLLNGYSQTYPALPSLRLDDDHFPDFNHYESVGHTIQPSLLFSSMPSKALEEPISSMSSSRTLPGRRSLSPAEYDSPTSSCTSSISGSTFSTPRTYHTNPSLPSIDSDAFNRISDGDADSDYHDDHSDDDDEEYVPVKEHSNSRKRRRQTIFSTKAIKHTTSSPRPVRPLPSAGPTPAKRPRIVSQSRLPQVSGKVADDIRKALASPNARGLDFECPACETHYSSSRMPDFKRHLAAHLRPDEADQSKGWWCKGMRYDNFHKLPKVDQVRLTKKWKHGATPYMFLGNMRIGGCRGTFSRRDALKRHLNHSQHGCVGTPGHD